MKSKDRETTVEILLATYNGGRYLKELLASVAAQTHRDWRLVVRDDGSADNTVDILKEFAGAHPGRVEVFEENKKNLGVCGSFSLLLERAGADYIMFCDQDDLWLPEKIEVTLGKMREVEGDEREIPALVHTDMIVVDEGLKRIADSFWRYQNLSPALTGLNRLLILNNVTGCAAMINLALARLAAPLPDEAIIHDWWAALVAGAMGRTGFVNRPTILYRQHGENVTGAARYSIHYFTSRLATLGRTSELLKRIVRQAGAFYLIYKDRLPPGERGTVRDFSRLLEMGRIRRAFSLVRHGYRGNGFLRNLGIFLLWMSIKGEKGAGGSVAVKDNA